MNTTDSFMNLSGLVEAIDHHSSFTDMCIADLNFDGMYEAIDHKVHMLTDKFDFAGIFEAAHHKVVQKFEVPAPALPCFMELPAEIRSKIIDQYLHNEVESDSIGKAIHHDRFGSPCCVWLWPRQLIVCDKHSEAALPHLMFPRWFPNLALTNHQLRGEVIVHMLQTTEQVTLKYDVHMPAKIARWMSRFLATFPNNQGFDALRDLNFPHIHWYRSTGPTIALTNPDVDLMLLCRNLTRVRFTFHVFRINEDKNICHPDPLRTMHP